MELQGEEKKTIVIDLTEGNKDCDINGSTIKDQVTGQELNYLKPDERYFETKILNQL